MLVLNDDDDEEDEDGEEDMLEVVMVARLVVDDVGVTPVVAASLDFIADRLLADVAADDGDDAGHTMLQTGFDLINAVAVAHCFLLVVCTTNLQCKKR